jgi:hypothetical protein
VSKHSIETYHLLYQMVQQRYSLYHMNKDIIHRLLLQTDTLPFAPPNRKTSKCIMDDKFCSSICHHNVCQCRKLSYQYIGFQLLLSGEISFLRAVLNIPPITEVKQQRSHLYSPIPMYLYPKLTKKEMKLSTCCDTSSKFHFGAVFPHRCHLSTLLPHQTPATSDLLVLNSHTCSPFQKYTKKWHQNILTFTSYSYSFFNDFLIQVNDLCISYCDGPLDLALFSFSFRCELATETGKLMIPLKMFYLSFPLQIDILRVFFDAIKGVSLLHLSGLWHGAISDTTIMVNPVTFQVCLFV